MEGRPQRIVNMASTTLPPPDSSLVPAATDVFKLWFADDSSSLSQVASQLQNVSMQLLILFFIISIGIFALRAFEGLDIQERVWTFVLCGMFIVIWPLMVLGLKEIIDGFNGYLVHFLGLENLSQNAINRSWFDEMAIRFSAPAFSQANPNDPQNQGFMTMVQKLTSGDLSEWMRITGASWWLGFINSLLSIAAAASRTVVQALYNIYFFLYVLLGPIVIARTVFSENLEAFLELVKEFVVVLLWPTMYVILAGFFVKTWASSSSVFLSSLSQVHIQLGLALAFIILTFLVPPLTKKFATALGTSIVTPFLRFGGIAMGLTAGQGFLGVAGRALGIAHVPHLAHSAEKYISLGEIVHETQHAEHYHHAAHNLHHALHKAQHALHHAQHAHGHSDHHDAHEDHHDGHHEEHHQHQHAHHESHESHNSHETHAQHSHHETHTSTHNEHSASDHGKDPLPKSSLTLFKSSDRALRKITDRFRWRAKDNSSSLSSLDSKETESTQLRGLDQIRERIRDFLAPIGSDKMSDMEANGIHHADLDSADPTIVMSYSKRVKAFHMRYGWLYDFEGRFWGTAHQRPVKHPPQPDEEVHV